MIRNVRFILVLGLAALLTLVRGVSAQTPPSYDFDFVTIGSPGNAAYEGDPTGGNPSGGAGRGRGSVAYEYRIARMEVTTAQWMEYVNTFSTQLPQEADFGRPFSWGAVADQNYFGMGTRWILNPAHPQAALVPVMGISWREAAEYVNWLNNDKSSSLDAITHGAYDTSTFTTNPDGSLNDQLRHDSDARYWIPTGDEWMKAVHHDPNKNGPGMEGWWLYPHRSDEPPVPGLPGVGETSAGFFPGVGQPSPRTYPLGSYRNAESPWGLLDASGGASEWLEDFGYPGLLVIRAYDGSRAGDPLSTAQGLDTAGGGSGGPPQLRNAATGLRIVSSIPAPCTLIIVLGMLKTASTRQRTEQ